MNTPKTSKLKIKLQIVCSQNYVCWKCLFSQSCENNTTKNNVRTWLCLAFKRSFQGGPHGGDTLPPHAQNWPQKRNAKKHAQKSKIAEMARAQKPHAKTCAKQYAKKWRAKKRHALCKTCICEDTHKTQWTNIETSLVSVSCLQSLRISEPHWYTFTVRRRLFLKYPIDLIKTTSKRKQI